MSSKVQCESLVPDANQKQQTKTVNASSKNHDPKGRKMALSIATISPSYENTQRELSVTRNLLCGSCRVNDPLFECNVCHGFMCMACKVPDSMYCRRCTMVRKDDVHRYHMFDEIERNAKQKCCGNHSMCSVM